MISWVNMNHFTSVDNRLLSGHSPWGDRWRMWIQCEQRHDSMDIFFRVRFPQWCLFISSTQFKTARSVFRNGMISQWESYDRFRNIVISQLESKYLFRNMFTSETSGRCNLMVWWSFTSISVWILVTLNICSTLRSMTLTNHMKGVETITKENLSTRLVMVFLYKTSYERNSRDFFVCQSVSRWSLIFVGVVEWRGST